jgi:hypothetical protein
MANPNVGAGPVDTVMTGYPAVKGITSAPGVYTKHKDLGPSGVDGGMPLKFFDDAVKATMGPVDSTMPVTPRGKR